MPDAALVNDTFAISTECRLNILLGAGEPQRTLCSSAHFQHSSQGSVIYTYLHLATLYMKQI